MNVYKRKVGTLRAPPGGYRCLHCVYSSSSAACLEVKVSETFLVAEVLSLQGNDTAGSSSLERAIETLDLLVSELHLNARLK